MIEKITEVIISNLEVYLHSHIQNLPQEKHDLAKHYFYKDMERIIMYCNENFSNILSEEFIKGLHKSLYPQGYLQKAIDKNGKECIGMIPGEYKTISISAKENQQQDIYEKVENVEKTMKNLISEFNNKILKTSDMHVVRDCILYFAVDFIAIHPFGDGNGRLDGILIDLLCLKYGISPLFLTKTYKANKNNFIFALNYSKQTRDLQYMYEFLPKNIL